MKKHFTFLVVLLLAVSGCKRDPSIQFCLLTSTNISDNWSSSIKQISSLKKKITKITYNNESSTAYQYNTDGKIETIKYFNTGATHPEFDSIIYDQNGLVTMVFHRQSFDTLLYNQSIYPYRKITYYLPHTLNKIYSLAYDINGNLITENYILYINPDTSNSAAILRERYYKRMEYDNKKNPLYAYGIKGNNIITMATNSNHIDTYQNYTFSYQYDSNELPISKNSFYTGPYGSSSSLTTYNYNCK